MSPPSRVVTVALFIIGLLALTAVPFSGVVMSTDQTTHQQSQQEWNEAVNVEFVAELQDNGDAEWTITTTRELETDEEVESYRSVADDFESGELPPLGFSAFEMGVNGVDDQTERDMRITDFERVTSSEAEIEDGVGKFSVRFTWENFARKDDTQLSIDQDVLVMENGNLWFEELGTEQTLTIIAPAEYGVRDANVVSRNGELHWEGPETFDDNSLEATFVGPGGSGPGNGTNNTTSGEPDLTETNSLLWMIIPITAVGIAVAVLLARRDRFGIELPTGLDIGSTVPAGTTESNSETENPAADEATTGGGAEAAEDSGGDDNDIDEELLSDEERVERLLSSNGGRMKQADIVKETDWSNAKVSQLLSSMEEDDRIDKLRIGRENLISFPDEDITDTNE